MIEHMKDRQIMTTRIVSAEREEVWQAWTNPIFLAQWWGPRGFRNTFYEFELRRGGAWRFIMHSPDGAHFPNENVFVEIVQPERIVFRHLAPVHGFLATSEFAKEGTGTAIRFSMLFPTVAGCARSRRYVEQGNEENFDRLEALLAVTV